MLTEQHEAGFTLLEVMVAFIIAAMALAVLFQGGVAGLRSARIAASYEQALARAQSRLAAACLPSGLQAQDQQGEDGGFHWHTRISVIGTASRQAEGVLGLAPRASSTVSLYAVSVAISWRGDGGQREVTLRTDRLGSAGRSGP